MNKKEGYLELLTKSYKESVEILFKKYGKSKDEYYRENSYNRFLNGEIKNITKGKYSRTSEGLYCHHIEEVSYENLSSLNYIKCYKYPFYLQDRDKLVYCDLFEHAILHVLISKETALEFGYSGYAEYIRPMIKDWYLVDKKPQFKRQWFQNCYEKAFLSFEDASIVLSKMDNIILNERKRVEEDKKNEILRIIEENSYRDLTSSTRSEIIEAFYILKGKGALSYNNQYLQQKYCEESSIYNWEPIKLEAFKKNMEDYDLDGILKNIKLFIDYQEDKIGEDTYREESYKYALTKEEARKMKINEKERKKLQEKQAKIEEQKAQEFYNKYPKFKKYGIKYNLKRQEINIMLFKYYDEYKCFIKFQGAMKKYSHNELLDKLYLVIK